MLTNAQSSDSKAESKLVGALQQSPEAVAEWFREQKEIPAILQVSQTVDSRPWEPLDRSFFQLFQVNPQKISAIFFYNIDACLYNYDIGFLETDLLERYMQGARQVIQEILQNPKGLEDEKTRHKLHHLSLIYSYALQFCSRYSSKLSVARPYDDEIREKLYQLLKSEVQASADFLLAKKDPEIFSRLLQHGSSVLLSEIAKFLVRACNTVTLLAFLEHGLNVHFRIQEEPTPRRNEPNLLEYALQLDLVDTENNEMVLKLLEKGAQFTLDFPIIGKNPPKIPDNLHCRILLWRCINLLELEVEEKNEIKAEPPLKVALNFRKKLIEQAQILLSYLLLGDYICEDLLGQCVRAGIHPTAEQIAALMHGGLTPKLPSHPSVFYFYHIALVATSDQWEELLAPQPQHDENLLLGFLMAYQKHRSEPIVGMELHDCKKTLEKYVQSDKESSRRLIRTIFFKDYTLGEPRRSDKKSQSSRFLVKTLFLKDCTDAIDLLIANCERFKTTNDFKCLFSSFKTDSHLSSFKEQVKAWTLFICKAVLINQETYPAFIQIAQEEGAHVILVNVLCQLKQGGQDFSHSMSPGVLDLMLKEIVKNNKDAYRSSLLKILTDKESTPQECEQHVWDFIQTTGYEPAQDPLLLTYLLKRMDIDQLLFLFPNALPESVATFQPMIEEEKKQGGNGLEGKRYIFQDYVDLTLALAARPGHLYQEIEVITKALDNLNINGVNTSLPTVIRTIIIDYIPQKGDYEGTIWPHFQPELAFPTDQKHAHALELRHYLPPFSNGVSTPDAQRETTIVKFQLFLKHFHFYITNSFEYISALKAAFCRTPTGQEYDYFAPLLYHRTVKTLEIDLYNIEAKFKKPEFKLHDNAGGASEEILFLFLEYYARTRQLPTDDLALRRKSIRWDRARKIVELGFQDRKQLSEKQLLALKDHAEPYQKELLQEAAEQKNLDYLNFLLGNPQQQIGIGLDNNATEVKTEEEKRDSKDENIPPKALTEQLEVEDRVESKTNERLQLNKKEEELKKELNKESSFHVEEPLSSFSVPIPHPLVTVLESPLDVNHSVESIDNKAPSIASPPVDENIPPKVLTEQLEVEDKVENKTNERLQLNKKEEELKKESNKESSFHVEEPSSSFSGPIPHPSVTVLESPLEVNHSVESMDDKDQGSFNELKEENIDLFPKSEKISLLHQGRTWGLSESEHSHWWKTWWILEFLPYLEAGEGVYLGEKLLAPLLESENFLPVHVLCTMVTSLVGLLIGIGMEFGLRKYVNSKEDNHSLIYHPSTPLVVALLACILAGPPLAIECLPFLFDKVPLLKGNSIEIYLLTVLFTGLAGGLLAAGQCYYNKSLGGKFTLFFTPLKQDMTDPNIKTATSYPFAEI